MAALRRSFLLTNGIQSRLAAGRSDFALLTRTITLKPRKAQPDSGEDHDLHNEKLGRPQSPHLTIYAPQITSMLSISHRMTGIALSGYMVALGVGALALPHDVAHYASMLDGNTSAVTLAAAKFIVAFPLCYHWCNGIRHLTWDTGRFLTNSSVNNTGYIMLAATTVLTAIVAAL